MSNSIGGWKDFWDKGVRYREITRRGRLKPQKFNPDALYNIGAMSLENLIMGFLAFRGRLPENHSLRDLVQGLETEVELPSQLKDRMLAMGRYQDICDLAAYRRTLPSWEDTEEFAKLAEEMEAFLGWREPILNTAAVTRGTS